MPARGQAEPTNVLFVCVGNSCRSQMAEALANHLGQGRVRAWSAGSSPLGWIVQETYDVMAEKGISLEGQWSKSVRDVPLDQMDAIISMGCEVSCPVPLGFKGLVLEWNIPDPFGGGLEGYRQARELINRQLKRLLVRLEFLPGPSAQSRQSRQTRVSSKDAGRS